MLLWGNDLFAQTVSQSALMRQALRYGNLKLSVADGRINTAGSQPRSYSTRNSNSAGRRESFQLRSINGRPQLLYELSTTKDKLTLSISGNDKVLFKRALTDKGKEDKKRAVEFEFSQKPGEPVRMTVGGEGEDRKVQTGETLWHLLMRDSEPLEEHVLPLLVMLRPGWRLMELADEAEAKLLVLARAGDLPNHNRWQALLDQLSDDSYARREAADRQLRQGGESALRFLRELDFYSLDAEQQFRVKRMINSMSARTVDDDADEIAARLSGDPAIWLILLSRDQEATRTIAAERLSTLLGKSIDFDPAADEKTRQRQIERLGKQLAVPAKKRKNSG